ncbi:MAG: PEP-CTERM sorting domain-containing protein [Phycisphaerales bacterium]|nr:PEP-CTERM sorting domain-containing protein [Phycisphaerales bacterium]
MSTDAFYSAAAYADPTFTVITPGATLTEVEFIPQGASSLSGGTLDPPPKLPEPTTILLLGSGLVALATARRKHKTII